MSSDPSRREFFRTIGRWTLVTALAGVVVKAAVRSRGAEANKKLQPLALCERCPAVNSCGLAAGKNARRFFGKAASQTTAAAGDALCIANRSRG